MQDPYFRDTLDGIVDGLNVTINARVKAADRQLNRVFLHTNAKIAETATSAAMFRLRDIIRHTKRG